MTFILIFNLIMSIAVFQSDQINHIGLKSKELKELMANQQCEFYFDKELELKKAKIIKYIDQPETKTLIYVLDKQDLCKYYMIIYDYLHFDSVIEKLNNTCDKIAEDEWVEVDNGKKFNKLLIKEDWYFTIITRKAN